MLLPNLLLLCVLSLCSLSHQATTDGIVALVRRLLPNHAAQFEFQLLDEKNSTENDRYSVSSSNGTIHVSGNSVSALAVGLRRYLTEYANVDIYWYIGSRLHLAPPNLPNITEPLAGVSVVPYRYHFNTVTFSYTTAFWNWDDWELQIDWMALHGINLPLAWVGQEKILLDTFRDAGFNDTEVLDFLSGPAFQAWNRFGNIQGDWSGQLPSSWIDGQFELQKKIVARMVDLGMTPILPAFTGFVPRAIEHVYPNASILIGSKWSRFDARYTNVTFLNPSENLDLFTQLQQNFIAKQQDAYGNVTSVYTLDQYNENDPSSGDLGFLTNLTQNTWRSLKAADPEAVWVMQAWLFRDNAEFWTNERIQAYLNGVPNSDMLILDLFSESSPQWQRTESYYGKPWIWCQLHNYGGNLGLYGQIMNLTIDPIQAIANSSSLVGFGLSMEAQEGNQIVYDLLLDQAWSAVPLDTDTYFHDWVSSRYNDGTGSENVPQSLYTAWDLLRTTAYNSTNTTFINAVQKSVLELYPRFDAIYNRTGTHGTTIFYDPTVLGNVWSLFLEAAKENPFLMDNPSYSYDIVDISRQVLSNAFTQTYFELVTTYNSTGGPQPAANANETISMLGSTFPKLLLSLDSVLSTNEHFRLSTWIKAAREWANGTDLAGYYEYNARNQLTLWGPTGEINDYASKVWGGLVAAYYLPRWVTFVEYIMDHPFSTYNGTELTGNLLAFSEEWQLETWDLASDETYGEEGQLYAVLNQLQEDWPSLFAPDLPQ